MPTTVYTAQQAYASSLIAGTAIGQSGNMTVAFNCTAGWLADVPVVGVQPNTANISAGWEVHAYRSTDGGNTYATVPTVSRSIARSPNTSDRVTLTLDRGQWLVRIISGGNVAATFSFSIGTQEILTAYVGN